MIQVLTNTFTFNTNEDITIPFTSDTSVEKLFIYGININSNAVISNNVANFNKFNTIGTYTCYLSDGANLKSNTFTVNIVAFNNLDTSSIKIFDLNKTYNLFNLSAKQSDTNGARGILFKIIKNSVPFLLDGLTIQVGGKKPDGTVILNNASILDIANSIIQIDLTTQMLAVPGVINLELNFIKDNTKLSSYPFQINVIKSVSDFKAIVSTNDFQVLNEALQKVNGYNKELENAVSTGKEEVYNKLEKEFETIKTEGTTTVNNLNTMKDELQQSIENMNNNSTLNKLEKLLQYNGIIGIDNTSINLKAERNKLYAVSSPIDNEIVAIDHTAMENGDKCYFVIASTNPAVKLIFNKERLVSSGVYIVGNKNQEFNGRDNGDLIVTFYKLGNCLRLAYDPSFGGVKENVGTINSNISGALVTKISNMYLSRGLDNIIRIFGYVTVNSNTSGSWVTVNLPITLPTRNYIVNLTCVDGRNDNSFRKIKQGNNQSTTSFDVFIDYCTGFNFEVVCPQV